jgi:hypothetical protein
MTSISGAQSLMLFSPLNIKASDNLNRGGSMKALLAYQQVRCMIQTGDMLEWRSRSVVGSMIRFFSCFL